MRKSVITLYLIVISLLGFTQQTLSQASAIRIAIVKNYINVNELAAIEQLIKAQTGWTYSLIDLESFPCCTSNMHQAWPKFVQNLWMATDDNGLAALVYGASEVKAKVADGTEVKFIEETNYPFAKAVIGNGFYSYQE